MLKQLLTTFISWNVCVILRSCLHIDRKVLQLLSPSLRVLPQLPATWIPGHTGMSALTRQEGKFMWHFCPTFLGLDQAPLLCLFVCLGETYTYESLPLGCMTVTFFAPQTVTLTSCGCEEIFPHCSSHKPVHFPYVNVCLLAAHTVRMWAVCEHVVCEMRFTAQEWAFIKVEVIIWGGGGSFKRSVQNWGITWKHWQLRLLVLMQQVVEAAVAAANQHALTVIFIFTCSRCHINKKCQIKMHHFINHFF